MLCNLTLWLFGFNIGSFYNELTLAILYRVVDTCDDREPCLQEQNDSSKVQGWDSVEEPPSRRDDVGIMLGRELYFVNQILHGGSCFFLSAFELLCYASFDSMLDFSFVSLKVVVSDGCWNLCSSIKFGFCLESNIGLTLLWNLHEIN